MKIHRNFADAEGARDLRLALAWIAALLFAGSAANFVAMWLRVSP